MEKFSQDRLLIDWTNRLTINSREILNLEWAIQSPSNNHVTTFEGGVDKSIIFYCLIVVSNARYKKVFHVLREP